MCHGRQIHDELLVLQCQAGDAAAFDALVRRWQERLWRHAWRLTGDENAAWDVLQDAWLAMGRDLRRLNEAAAFGVWAYRVVTHKCRDWIRREQRRRKTHEAYARRDHTEEPTPAGADERRSDLAEALARLPGTERALLALRYEAGFDIRQISAILGLPAGTVKSRLFHVRQRLRATMEESNHG